MRFTPSAAVARITAFLVACLFMSAGLASYVHQAWEEHVVCAEHGELVHVGEYAGDRRGQGESPDTPDDPGHEHCNLVPVAGARAELDLNAPSIGAPTCARLLTLVPDRALPPRGIDLRLAPKTSPPRA